MEFRCIQCGFPNKTLYIQYSPGNIRLMKCDNCKAVADEYIECEIMIVLIDLILHKAKAYRHLFFNVLSGEALNFEGFFWKVAFMYLLLDAYRILLLSGIEQRLSSSVGFDSVLWSCEKTLMDVFCGNFIFLGTLLLGTRKLLNTSAGIFG
ncbi:unnamed protein product [Ilex paraguariensis]|uniref:Protein ARV n=1 Tax=Ilex paraguariensis TaxID=185542 RepID=A0ABC8S179_9AQUA